MKFLAFLHLAALAAATTFTLSAYAPGTEVDGAVLNAAGSAFYTGITGPATYCPIDTGCPEVGGTVVFDGLTAMAVSPFFPPPQAQPPLHAASKPSTPSTRG